jgi:Lrp/AsnC family leucine-responsive transcriptional regulator
MDSIDKTIISTLQKNGRTTNVELARLAQLAPSSMLERVRRLEERGVIKGYRAVLDPTALGYNVQAIIMITLEHSQLNMIDETEQRIRSIPEVKACFLLAGVHDFMVHVVVRDIEHLAHLVKYKLYEVGIMRSQETFLILSPLQEDEGYSLKCMDDDGK